MTLSTKSKIAGCVIVVIPIMTALYYSFKPDPREVAREVAPGPAPPSDAPIGERYVGDRACRECHPGETALHSRSGHSRTLRPPARVDLVKSLIGRTVADPDHPKVSWTLRAKDQEVLYERKESDRVEERLAEWVFGSGVHAMTLVSVEPASKQDPRSVLLEHRLSYFTKDDKLNVTIGQEANADLGRGVTRTAFGRRLDPDRSKKCFDCHVTLSSRNDPSSLDPRTLIPNVGCEACHGPAREHVEAARRGGEIPRLAHGEDQPSMDLQVRLCAQCHRHPRDFGRHMLRPDNLDLVRFQPVGLMMSKCYQNGFGNLRCTTCHDPHAKPSRDATKYETTCISCHGPTGGAICSVKPAPASGCVSCHMPKRKVPEGFEFTDHWIRKPGRANEEALMDRLKQGVRDVP